ncbi:MAG: glycosyltransferase family 2 protein [Actinomycetota bacterium]|nr:glycosyltransferase family 2 protein [Actinomycetota bacterium]
MDIVLPCLDEAQALPWVLDRIPENARAVVVDNGSTDGSPDIARARGAVVVDCPQRGYGAACHAGLEAATAEYVAVCDCDASLDPGDAMRMVQMLRDGADLVVARRRPVSFAAWSPHARVANLELARRVRRRTGLTLRDVGPIRVARREPLLALPITDRRSGYPVETVLRAAEAGWTIVGVDVAYTPRAGRSKVTGTMRGTLQAVRDMSAVLAR